ncbi:DUF489 family protein [Escherichia coli]
MSGSARLAASNSTSICSTSRFWPTSQTSATDAVRPIGPRIQVAGTPLFLQQPLVQHKVRALLLAGIRACVLWRQLGGSRTESSSLARMVELAKRY